MSHMLVFIVWVLFSSSVPGRPLESHPMDQFPSMHDCLAYVRWQQKQPKYLELTERLTQVGDTMTLMCLPAGVQP